MVVEPTLPTHDEYRNMKNKLKEEIEFVDTSFFLVLVASMKIVTIDRKGETRHVL